MKTKHFIMFLLFISLGLVSCSDNDDEQFFLYKRGGVYFPDQPISSLVIEVTGSEGVGMTGGIAPYTLETGDENIVKAKMDETGSYVIISPVQLGRTYLQVTDANGLTAKIDIKIVEDKQSLNVYRIGVKIEGISDDEKKQALEKEIIEDADIHETGSLEFVYDTKNSGTVVITPSKDNTSDAVPFTSELKQIDEKTFTPFIYVKYNGVDHVYYFSSSERLQAMDENTRIELMHYWLVEDVTEIYKNKEAYSEIISAKRIYMGR